MPTDVASHYTGQGALAAGFPMAWNVPPKQVLFDTTVSTPFPVVCSKTRVTKVQPWQRLQDLWRLE
jgi:hypothetical protein